MYLARPEKYTFRIREMQFQKERQNRSSDAPHESFHNISFYNLSGPLAVAPLKSLEKSCDTIDDGPDFASDLGNMFL